MNKTLAIAAIAALVATGFAGSAFAGQPHRRAPANADAYYATYDHQAAASAAAPASRDDFGSYGAATTARNLGY